MTHVEPALLIGVGLLTVLPLMLITVVRTVNGTWVAGDLYVPFLGLPAALLILIRGWTGSWSQRQLRVDVPAGKLQLADGTVRRLDELGALSIEKELKIIRHPVRNTEITWWRLRATSLETPLFSAVYESETKIRYEHLDAAVLESQLRRILEGPRGEGGAFRDAPDPLPAIMNAAGSSERAAAALRGLARAPDRDIRTRAASFRARLTSHERATRD